VGHDSGGIGVLPGRAANPAVHDLVVSFSLPTAEPAAVALMDLSGRIVARYKVDARPGSHVINLDSGGMAPGIYLVRLTQGGRSATRKVCVVH
jgi:hypothetical protein